MVFLKNLFSRRYSNFKFEKFDSLQANTAQSRNFLTGQPIKRLTKNGGLCSNSYPIKKYIYILYEGKAKTKFMPRSVSQLWISANFSNFSCGAQFLRVFNCFFFQFDSAPFQPAQSHLFREYLREHEFFRKTALTNSNIFYI